MVSIGPKFPETGRLFFETGPASAYSIVATWIAKHQKDGRIGEGDPYRLAVLFLDMLIGEHQLSSLTGQRRYDKLAANYLAFIQLASIRLWLRVNDSRPNWIVTASNAI
jgi:hypothetical protein